MTTDKKLKITLMRSINGISKYQKECVNGLGLRRIRHEVVLQDSPTVRGLVSKINYMLSVEEA